jgi:NAD(P)-dependent dehydrogenase (short-subunit alcohol dehydrogenase family)
VEINSLESHDKKLVIIFGSGTGIGHYLLHRGLNEGYLTLGISRDLREKCRVQGLDSKCDIHFKSLDVNSKKIYYLCDLNSESERRDLFSVLEKLSIGINEIHSIICIGGVKTIDKYENTVTSDILEDFQLNILTPMLIVRDLYKLIATKSRSSITLLGGSGEKPYPYRIPYAAAKSGLARFVESIATEWVDLNILINLALPGPVNTELFEHLYDSKLKNLDSAFSKELDLQKLNGGVSISCVGDLIYNFLIAHNSTLSGKTISARFDPWEEWIGEKIELSESALTFRRVNPA